MRFVLSFAKIEKPLTDLLKRGGPFRPTEEQLEALNRWNNRSIFNPNRETELRARALVPSL